MRSKHIRLLVISLLLLSQGIALAWDGKWTDGKSGQDYIYDKEDSTGKAGSDPPQTFPAPPLRDYANVDPEELDDYKRHKDYTPYALLRIPQALHYEGTVIPSGYYQVKAGNWGGGSLNHSLNTPVSGSLSNPANTARVYQNPSAASNTQASPQATDPHFPMQRVFVIKHLGNVVAVVPIHQIKPYNPKKQDKIKVRRHALAWIEMEDRQPVLKFYNHHWLYITHFQ